MEFCDTSNLKVNDVKSKAFCSLSMSRSVKEGVHNIVNISFTNNLGRYLGVAILQSHVKSDDFNHVIQKNQHQPELLKRKDAQQGRDSHYSKSSSDCHLASILCDFQKKCAIILIELLEDSTMFDGIKLSLPNSLGSLDPRDLLV